MPHELWLQVARWHRSERGFGLTHKPGDVVDDLLGQFAIDPLTGFACCRLDVTLEGALQWVHDDDAYWGQGYARGEAWPLHVDPTREFESSTAEPLADGHGFFFPLIVYEPPEGETAEPLRVLFGTHFELVLLKGVAELKKGETTLGYASLFDEDEWYGEVHWLYCYCVGTRVIVRRIGKEVEQFGVVGDDPTAAQHTPPDALREGKVTVRGRGQAGFAVAPERHETTFLLEHTVIELPEPLSTEPQSRWRGLVPDDQTPDEEGNDNEPALTLLDDEGVELSGGVVERWTYRVETTLDSVTGPNFYLASVQVAFPPMSVSDGLAGVNLTTLPGAAVKEVEERRSLDCLGTRLRMKVWAEAGELSPYVQPNMTVLWRPEGFDRFWGFTTRPHLRQHNVYEELEFECEDQWKGLYHEGWPGDVSYAGKLLGAAYQDVLVRSGFPAAAVNVSAGGYLLPEEEQDGEPLFDFEPGTPMSDIIEYLRDQFGAEDQLFFGPDGEFYAVEPPTAHSGVTFYLTTSDAEVWQLGLRNPTVPRILRSSWYEEMSEEGFANDVWVAGWDKQQRPLLAIATDWSSINNPTSGNYWGGFKRMLIVDAGLTTQEAVDWVCAQVFRRVRYPTVFGRGRAMYVPSLLEGMLVDVDTRGTWRILSMTTQWHQRGFYGLADYEMVRVA